MRLSQLSNFFEVFVTDIVLQVLLLALQLARLDAQTLSDVVQLVQRPFRVSDLVLDSGIMSFYIEFLLVVTPGCADANRKRLDLRDHAQELGHQLRMPVPALVQLDEQLHVQVVP